MQLDKLTALVVDDMEAMRKITNDQLKRIGVGRVIQAEDGKKALAALEQTRVDLILSDWNMPVMDGLGLLKEVKDNELTRHIPFLMITAE